MEYGRAESNLIGQNIQRIMRLQGTKQKTLADACEVSQGFLSEVLNGKKKMPVKLLECIAAELQWVPEDLRVHNAGGMIAGDYIKSALCECVLKMSEVQQVELLLVAKKMLEGEKP